jgi:hypothetical protein
MRHENGSSAPSGRAQAAAYSADRPEGSFMSPEDNEALGQRLRAIESDVAALARIVTALESRILDLERASEPEGKGAG